MKLSGAKATFKAWAKRRGLRLPHSVYGFHSPWVVDVVPVMCQTELEEVIVGRMMTTPHTHIGEGEFTQLDDTDCLNSMRRL